MVAVARQYDLKSVLSPVRKRTTTAKKYSKTGLFKPMAVFSPQDLVSDLLPAIDDILDSGASDASKAALSDFSDAIGAASSDADVAAANTQFASDLSKLPSADVSSLSSAASDAGVDLTSALTDTDLSGLSDEELVNLNQTAGLDISKYSVSVLPTETELVNQGLVTAEPGITSKISSALGDITNSISGISGTKLLAIGAGAGLAAAGIGIGLESILAKPATTSTTPPGGGTSPTTKTTGSCASLVANNALTSDQLATCQSCNGDTLTAADQSSNSAAYQQWKTCMASAAKTATPPTTKASNGAPTGATTGTASSTGNCTAGGGNATQVAACQSCGGDVLTSTDISSKDAAYQAYLTCMKSASNASGASTASTTGNCAAAVAAGSLTSAQGTTCSSCGGDVLTSTDISSNDAAYQAYVACMQAAASGSSSGTSGTSGTTQNTAGACASSYTAAGDVTACQSCGGDTLDTSDATAVATYQSCMATAGASSSTTPSNPTTVVGTIQKYAIPLAIGAVLIGVVVVGTHGKYWGKKKPGVKTPPKTSKTEKVASKRH